MVSRQVRSDQSKGPSHSWMTPTPSSILPAKSVAADSVSYLECEVCCLLWRTEIVRSLSGKNIKVVSFRRGPRDEWEYKDWPSKCTGG